MYRTHKKELVVPALLVALTVMLPGSAMAQRFSPANIVGKYVLSLDGSFSSAPPPFTGEALDFEASLIALFTFDGSGNMYGEHTLAFHNVEIPFDVRSRFAVEAKYSVEPDGRLLIESKEFRLDEAGGHGPSPDNIVDYACYLVAVGSAECTMLRLTTYQQGPEPKLLPSTMSGSLERQR
jgi:hypothetical protein